MPTKRQPVTEQPEGFVERLAQTLGVTANATHIFASPIERDGVTVIPVAKARYGFGGGSGQKRGEGGSGGGGGAVITPAGYIEITRNHTRYRPIRDPFVVIACAVAGGLATLLLAGRIFKPGRQ
ncbi:MAG: spore germination protein GerW family protein [Blastocatellia bacterium]